MYDYFPECLYPGAIIIGVVNKGLEEAKAKAKAKAKAEDKAEDKAEAEAKAEAGWRL